MDVISIILGDSSSKECKRALFLASRGFKDPSRAEPYSSVGSVADLRTEGRWFDPRLGQYSLRRFMIVIATTFIALSPLSVFSTIVTMWESSQWLGKNIVRTIVVW